MPKAKLPPPTPPYTDSPEEEITIKATLPRSAVNQMRVLQRAFDLTESEVIAQVLEVGIGDMFAFHLVNIDALDNPNYPHPMTRPGE